MGLGGFPGTHELFLGMLGMHGTYWANMAMIHSDLIIAIGARFDDRVTGKLDEFATGATIIHIDIDPSSISKNIPVHIPIVGDAKNVLKKMLDLLDKEDEKVIQEYRVSLEEWHEQIEKWRVAHPLSYKQGEGPLKPQFVMEKIYELTNGRAIIATDVGQHQMWVAQYYKFNKPRALLTSGGLGTMGYGFPAAIGAQVAFPDKLVIDVAGDGSIQMNIQEMATAVQYNLPVKVFIINNRYLGMVRQWQELFFRQRYSQVDLRVSPDYVKIAEAYGATGLRATKPDEVEYVIRKAIDTPGPVIVDFVVDPYECVYPMVPAGAPLSKMLLA